MNYDFWVICICKYYELHHYNETMYVYCLSSCISVTYCIIIYKFPRYVTFKILICDQICQKWSCLIGTCTVSRHTFHCYLLAISMDQHCMCSILLMVEQSAFTQASFSSLSDLHECSSGLQMIPSFLSKQTADCDSPHNWLMSLDMDLAALCDMWGWKWHQWESFGCFSMKT